MSDKNKLNEKQDTSPEQNKEPRIQRFFSAMGFSEIWNLGSLSRNMPFILFVAVLAWFHIGNNHKAVNYIRSITKMEREIKELRWEYMTVKSELMHESKQSEVAAKVEELGLKELTDPPHIIDVDKK